MRRILFDILILLSLFLVPWWVTGILCVIGAFIFNDFYELVIAGLIMYSLYGVGSPRWIASTVWLPVMLIAVFFLISWLKKSIIFYKKA